MTTTTKQAITLEIPRSLTAIREIASAERSTRYALNSVHIVRRSGVALVEATTGKMLCRVAWDSPGEDLDTLIPGEAFKGGKGRGPLVLSVAGNFVRLNGEEHAVTEAKFPPCDDVLPALNRPLAATITLDTLKLLRIAQAYEARCRAVAVLNGQEDKDHGAIVALCGSPGEGTFRVESTSRKSENRIPGLNLKPESVTVERDFTVGVNARFVRDLTLALRSVHGIGKDAPELATLEIPLPGRDDTVESAISIGIPGEQSRFRSWAILMPVYMGG